MYSLQDFLIFPNCFLIKAIEKINKNKKGFLIVVDKEYTLLGVLTDGDIRRFILKISKGDKGIDFNNILIEDVYNRKCIYINIHQKFQEVADIFKDMRINFLPIVDKNKRVVNVLTKKQFHILLMENFNLNINDNKLLNLDESVLESEVYTRPWGFYKTLFLSNDTHVKILLLFPQEETSYQTHLKREEYWIIIKGIGEAILSKSKKKITPGDYIYIPKGCNHQIINTSPSENLIIVEVQLGHYFGEDDIIRLEDKYKRRGHS